MIELSEMRQELINRTHTIMSKAQDYRNSFDNYAYLWVDDRKEFMRQFLLYNHVLTTEEIEAHAEEGVPECPPTLDQFKEQVSCVTMQGVSPDTYQLYLLPETVGSLTIPELLYCSM